MRLIDADALIDAVKQAQRSGKYSETTILATDIFIEFLNGQPTAYDVETVITELEKYAEENKGERMQDGIGSCVRIVRNGGKE